MPILDYKVETMGLAGFSPKYIYLRTDDTRAAVQVTGYLNNLVRSGVPINDEDIAVVTSIELAEPNKVRVYLYDIDFDPVTNNWTLIAFSNGTGGGANWETVGNSGLVGGVLGTLDAQSWNMVSGEDILCTANRDFRITTTTRLISLNAATNVNITAVGNDVNLVATSGSIALEANTVAIPLLAAATKPNVVYYDSASKEISYGTPTGFTSVNVQVFDTAGAHTYTPTANMKYCVIKCQGAGGSGASTNFPAGSSGGGAGGYAEGVFDAATIGASQAVTIGAGGAGVITASGNAGGSSSVGALLSATGGAGGILAGPAGGGGAGTGGYLQTFGGQGSVGFIIGGQGHGGAGGNSLYDYGYIDSSNVNRQGNPGKKGSGGSGAINITSDVASGDGGDGIVIITEYI